jgi:hypothetical protein
MTTPKGTKMAIRNRPASKEADAAEERREARNRRAREKRRLAREMERRAKRSKAIKEGLAASKRKAVEERLASLRAKGITFWEDVPSLFGPVRKEEDGEATVRAKSKGLAEQEARKGTEMRIAGATDGVVSTPNASDPNRVRAERTKRIKGHLAAAAASFRAKRARQRAGK